MVFVENLSTGIKKFLQNNTCADILFLIIVIFLTRILFVFKLGFYSDDWSFFERFYFKEPGYLQWYRSVYLWFYYLMYLAFGFEPTGYHLVNTLLFFLNAILLYIILRKLLLPRLFALSIPLVYFLLPHYSTNHFWVSVIPYNLCLLFYLLSLFADLKALETNFPKLLMWKFISLSSIIACALIYEVFIPFFYLNLVISYYHYKKLRENNQTPGNTDKEKISGRLAYPISRLVLLLLTNFLFLKIILIIKLTSDMFQKRVIMGESSLVSHFNKIIINAVRLDYKEYDYGFNIKQSIKINFVEYGIRLPEKLFKIFRDYSDVTTIILSLILAFIIFFYLIRVVKQHNFTKFNLSKAANAFKIGIVLYAFGYSIFLTNLNILFSTTGIANRASIGAALGIAVLWIFLFTVICQIVRYEKFRNIFFTFSVTALCISGFLINNTISSFWVKAYEEENRILEEIRNEFPALPDSTRLLLDGSCPYVGPAIVYESFWDLAGALRVAYSEKSLDAGVVTPKLEVTEEGVVIPIYEYNYFFPYEILIYNYNEKKTFIISNKEDATKYFESVNSNFNNICPPGDEGHGIKIF